MKDADAVNMAQLISCVEFSVPEKYYLPTDDHTDQPGGEIVFFILFLPPPALNNLRQIPHSRRG